MNKLKTKQISNLYSSRLLAAPLPGFHSAVLAYGQTSTVRACIVLVDLAQAPRQDLYSGNNKCWDYVLWIFLSTPAKSKLSHDFFWLFKLRYPPLIIIIILTGENLHHDRNTFITRNCTLGGTSMLPMLGKGPGILDPCELFGSL